MLQSLTRKAKLLLDHRSYPSHPGTAIANVSQPGKGPELRMALLPTTVLTPLLALLSLYAAQKSYIAITNLQKYEERTEKAAKYLDKAEHDLYKTRVTQASGAAAIFLSLISSVSLLFEPSASPLLELVNVAATAAAYMHITGFWKAKAEVPFVGGFNEGIRKSNDLRRLLVWLGVGWAFTGTVGFLWG